MKQDALTGLMWVGGKSFKSPTGTGKWVASLLPPTADLYVEPFAGMLGVLLNRQPAMAEIASDLNGYLMNWWLVIQRPPLRAELAERVEGTPSTSDGFLHDARQWLAEWQPERDGRGVRLPDLEAAYHWTLVVCTAIFGEASIGGGPANLRYGDGTRRSLPSSERLRRLGDRLRHVQLVERDGLEVIRLVADKPGALVYCDPPYPSADASFYSAGVDPGELAETLLTCRGKVALSGQASDDYPALEAAGWVRSERETYRSSGWRSVGGGEMKRVVEVLWTNYDPGDHGAARSLFEDDV